ncbi:MAG TPA: LLM class F420-dependent oxidoreductase [Gaiellaceae bacterium]|jgi:F420-dependent oxidoreductase-like protein|nr:LLM class F420-dependent oxidoreductase [Gaiellaceae bacterium]
MRAPVRLGLQIPNFDLPGVAPEQLLDRLTAIAGAAEDAGFDSIFVMDHLHQIPGVGPPENRMLEGNTVLAALAGRTTRANLGLMVAGVTYRNPALLAKITTTIDVLSGGRAILGIGGAWYEEEHRAYGFEFPPVGERLARLGEALQIARMMFTQEQSTFEGRYYRVEGVMNNPRPIRGDIPILVGGSGERKTLKLVAQYADACNIFGDPDRVRHLLGVLDAHCADVGRDPAQITKTRLGTLVVAPTHEEAEALLATWPDRVNIPEERRRMVMNLGDPDEVGGQIEALVAAGLDGFIFNMPNPNDLDAVALAGETVRRALG